MRGKPGRWPHRAAVVGLGVAVLVALVGVSVGMVAGGDGPVRPARRLARIPQAAENLTIPYEKSQFGGWSHDDCVSTRVQVLLDTAVGKVRQPDRCSVTAGVWVDRWTGKKITDPKKIQIDHTVPKANAWRSGAWAWSRNKLRRYMNDRATDHLVVTSARTNNRKGDDSPDEWKPPDRSTWCDYAHAWVRIKKKWELTTTAVEWKALKEMAATC